MLIDSSKIPRETYYACPHCHAPLNVIVKNEKGSSPVFVEASESAVRETPEGCRYHFGHLRSLPSDIPFPDECLTCSMIMKCACKK